MVEKKKEEEGKRKIEDTKAAGDLETFCVFKPKTLDDIKYNIGKEYISKRINDLDIIKKSYKGKIKIRDQNENDTEENILLINTKVTDPIEKLLERYYEKTKTEEDIRYENEKEKQKRKVRKSKIKNELGTSYKTIQQNQKKKQITIQPHKRSKSFPNLSMSSSSTTSKKKYTKKKSAVTPIVLLKGEEEVMKDNSSTTTSTTSTPITPTKQQRRSTSNIETPSAIHLEMVAGQDEELTDESGEEEDLDDFHATFDDVIQIGMMKGINGGKKRLWIYTPHNQTLMCVPNINMSLSEILSYFQFHLKADSEMKANPLIMPFIFIIEDFVEDHFLFDETIREQQCDKESIALAGMTFVSPLMTTNVPKEWMNDKEIEELTNDSLKIKKKSAKQKLIETANAIVDAITVFTNSLQHLPTKASNLVKKKNVKEDHIDLRQNMPLLCGLSNLGNTCYLNASLQSLVASKDLSEYFLTNAYKGKINAKSPFEGKLAERYGALMHTMFEHDLSEPHKLKSLLASRHRQFSGFHQHDAQELLMCLLEGLHIDLIQPSTRVRPIKLTSKDDQARHAWLRYRARHASIIVNLFYGQLTSAMTCSLCHRTSLQHQPFLFLPIPLPSIRIRYIHVVLMATTLDDPLPRQFAAKPRKYAVKVTSHTLFSEVQRKFATLIGVDTSRVVLCYLLQQQLQVVNPLDTVDRADFSYLFAFTLPQEPLKRTLQLYVQHHDAAMGIVGLSFLLFIPLSKLENVKVITKESTNPNVPPGTMEEYAVLSSMRPLYDHLSTYMSRYLKPKLSHRVPLDDEDEEEDENAFLFRLLHEKTFLDPFHAPPPIRLHDRVYLGETLTVYCEGTFNDDKALNVVIHAPSVHPQKKYDQHVRSLMLDDCLEAFLETEVIHSSIKCDHCKNVMPHCYKQLYFSVLPLNLIVQLSRFSLMGRHSKNSSFVDYPMTFNARMLFPNDPVRASMASHFVYELYAVILHRGGLSSGHYTALIRNYFDASWYLMNDSSMRPVHPSQVRSPSAYILFYRMRPLMELSLQ